MGIRFNCENCGKPFEVESRFAGKRARCNDCSHVMRVPAAPVPPPLPLPPPLPVRFATKPVREDEDGIPPIVIKLILGILIVGVITCVWIEVSNRWQPNSPMASSSAGQSNATFQTANSQIANVHFPDERQIKLHSPGVDIYPMIIDGSGPGIPMHVRLYLPAGPHEPHSLPCVFITPAGTRLLYGSSLGDGDTPEHLPYARHGFAVLAYELSGDLPEASGRSLKFGDFKGPIQQFMAADGGLANTRIAIDFVLAKVPEVDRNQLFTAGHSSAATMALNAAAADHRLRAVAAYAPACDVVARWGDNLAKINLIVPGAANLAAKVSPNRHVNEISCPVLLFHADDDVNVSSSDVGSYVAALQAAGKDVEFYRVATGGHYQSMIDQGIAAGIEFFKSHGARPAR